MSKFSVTTFYSKLSIALGHQLQSLACHCLSRDNRQTFLSLHAEGNNTSTPTRCLNVENKAAQICPKIQLPPSSFLCLRSLKYDCRMLQNVHIEEPCRKWNGNCANERRIVLLIKKKIKNQKNWNSWKLLFY